MTEQLTIWLLWSALALTAYTYLGFYGLLALLARLFGRPARPEEGHCPSVSLLISAHNEEDVIASKLENALAQDYPDDKLEICLVSDGSDDRTLEIARAFENRGVRVFHFDDRRGKNLALNDAVPLAHGEILVFSDANAMYAEDAIRKLARNFADATVGCVVGAERRRNPETDANLPDGLYWRYENRLKQLQSSLRSVLVANGSIFAVRRECFRTLHSDVANDFQTPMDVGAQGKDIIYEPAAISYERSVPDYLEEFHRKVRIVTRGLVGTVRCFHEIRGLRLFLFVSHKFLRWFVGFLLLTLLMASGFLALSSPLYAAILLLQLLLYCMAVAGWVLQRRGQVPRLLDVAFYFSLVNVAAMSAAMHFLRGRSFSTWEKSRSVRDPHLGGAREPSGLRSPARSATHGAVLVEPVILGTRRNRIAVEEVERGDDGLVDNVVLHRPRKVVRGSESRGCCPPETRY